MQYSVVSVKKLNDTLAFRLDAEYFHPSALLYEDRINKLHGTTIKEYGCRVVSGPFGSSLKSESYLPSGIPFVRISDLKDFRVDTDELIYISKNDHNRLLSSKLNIGDLVLSKVGNTIGVVSRVTDDIGECNISENNIGIRFPKNISADEKVFILTFLNSNAGQSQILRSISGNAQPKLNVSDIEFIKIPHLSADIIKNIRLIVDESTSLILKSKQFYQTAEQILLSELGFLNWRPKHHLSFIKNFSDAKTADRLDAEYFQPMYDEIINIVKSYKNGFVKLGNQFRQNKKTFKMTPDKIYRYVEIGCVRISDGGIEPLSLYGHELPANAKIKLMRDDVIVSKVRPYRGAIGIVESDDFVGSSAFTVLQASTSIKKETLMVLLRTNPYLEFSLKFNTGTSYPTITNDDILNFPIPLIPHSIQESIKQKIQDANNMRNKSNTMLEIAKEGVEMAIEKNEQTAMEWINKNVKD